MKGKYVEPRHGVTLLLYAGNCRDTPWCVSTRTYSLVIVPKIIYIPNMKNEMSFKIIIICVLFVGALFAESIQPMSIARLKYDGGGDWYSNPGSLENLLRFIATNSGVDMADKQAVVEADSPELFHYSYLYMNGHGNVYFSDKDVRRLRHFLENGGFLHADDNYGMDHSFRREMKKVFPHKDWVELPFDHPIYHQEFNFPKGLPKIHEHDNKPAQGLGLFHEGKLVVFYTYECDLGDGWESPEVHHDPEAIRTAALKMGSNIFIYHLNK